jgi:hypothetical protein
VSNDWVTIPYLDVLIPRRTVPHRLRFQC